jgi:RNA polymerase sigma-70 factor, ECF subfamily
MGRPTPRDRGGDESARPPGAPVRRSPCTDPTADAAEERALVEAARGGNELAFGELVDPLRRELYAHCYRMLASVHDAEDALQEVMLRAWRALDGYEGRAPLRSWLHRIATNVCLDAIAKRPKRVVPLDDPSPANGQVGAQPSPPPDQEQQVASARAGAAVIETDYERREAATRAFRLALYLPTKQRAALILRDVLGFSARETASSLETTPTAVNSALQRARANLDEGLVPDRARRSRPALGDRRSQLAADQFMDALRRGDIDAIVGIAADSTLRSMRPRRWRVLERTH